MELGIAPNSFGFCGRTPPPRLVNYAQPMRSCKRFFDLAGRSFRLVPTLFPRSSALILLSFRPAFHHARRPTMFFA
jgi:hypothetical protein